MKPVAKTWHFDTTTTKGKTKLFFFGRRDSLDLPLARGNEIPSYIQRITSFLLCKTIQRNKEPLFFFFENYFENSVKVTRSKPEKCFYFNKLMAFTAFLNRLPALLYQCL